MAAFTRASASCTSSDRAPASCSAEASVIGVARTPGSASGMESTGAQARGVELVGRAGTGEAGKGTVWAGMPATRARRTSKGSQRVFQALMLLPPTQTERTILSYRIGRTLLFPVWREWQNRRSRSILASLVDRE